MLTLAEAGRVAERLRGEDATRWGASGTPEIAQRLGRVTIAQRLLDVRALLADACAADELRALTAGAVGGDAPVKRATATAATTRGTAGGCGPRREGG